MIIDTFIIKDTLSNEYYTGKENRSLTTKDILLAFSFNSKEEAIETFLKEPRFIIGSCAQIIPITIIYKEKCL